MSEEKKPELLPCPFCGGTETKEQRTGVDDECVFIQCITCEAGGPTSFPRQDNDSVTWNTRISDLSLLEGSKILREKNSRLVNAIECLILCCGGNYEDYEEAQSIAKNALTTNP